MESSSRFFNRKQKHDDLKMLAVPLGTFFKLLLSTIANTCMMKNSKRTELCLLLYGVERNLGRALTGWGSGGIIILNSYHIQDGLGKIPLLLLFL
jgi:hypothetical protein